MQSINTDVGVARLLLKTLKMSALSKENAYFSWVGCNKQKIVYVVGE